MASVPAGHPAPRNVSVQFPDTTGPAAHQAPKGGAGFPPAHAPKRPKTGRQDVVGYAA